MNHLPDELLCSIFKYTIQDINQLLVLQLVNKRFQRLSNNGYLWYYAIKKMYPKWINNIQYAHDKQPLIHWKQFVLRMYKQKNFITSTKFDLKNILSKKKLDRSYSIEEPIISDIDPITNTGILAISKSAFPTRHKILFYSYPNYTFLRKLELHFTIDVELNWTCQIICMQTIQINNEKVRLFAISLNEPTTDEEQSQTNWRNIIIYRLFDDGSTTCLANVNTNLLGRGAWFFSTMNKQQKEWLQLISPDVNYDQKVFLMIFGLGPHQFEGLVQIINFDITTNDILSDPSKTIYEWNEEEFIISPKNKNISNTTITTIEHTITTLYLEARVSCMVHFSHIKELEHLIITGNFHGEDLSIYDWRFGIKVGVLPKKNDQNTDITAQPWGLEYTFAITPPSKHITTHKYGPRLIVVGDCQDKFEIKVWDISFLLNIKWDPFDNTKKVLDKQDIPQGMMNRMYKSWWDKRTNTLEQLAINLYNGNMEKLPYTTTSINPYVHLLEAKVKYIAYINLNTFIYLLQEDGILSVLDIESGNILTTIDTGGKSEDVNVIGNNEIVVTRKLELKRCILPT